MQKSRGVGKNSPTILKQFIVSQPMGANARESLDEIFQIAVISEYVSKFGWDPFSDLRD